MFQASTFRSGDELDDSDSGTPLSDEEYSENDSDYQDSNIGLNSDLSSFPPYFEAKHKKSRHHSKTGIALSGCLSKVGEISFDEEFPLVIRLSLDNAHWAIGLSSGAIKLFYRDVVANPNPVYSLTCAEHTSACTDIRFVPSIGSARTEKTHLLIASYASGQIRVWHYTNASHQSRLLATFSENRMNLEDDPSSAKENLQLRQRKISRKKKLSVSSNRSRRDTDEDSDSQSTHRTNRGKIDQLDENTPTGTQSLNQILTCDVSLDGGRFITGGEDAIIRVYDLAQLKLINTCYSARTNDRMLGHVMRICVLKYHPWGSISSEYAHIFVSGGWDDSIQIWDDRKQQSIWQYYGPHVCGTDSLDIDSAQNHIVTTSWRRDDVIIEVWKFKEEAVENSAKGLPILPEDPSAFTPLAQLREDSICPPSMGYVAQWFDQKLIIFAGSNHNIMRIIDRGSLHTLGYIKGLESGIYSAASYVEPSDDMKKPNYVAFCSGNKAFFLKCEKK